jgi:hypothetical protein
MFSEKPDLNVENMLLTFYNYYNNNSGTVIMIYLWKNGKLNSLQAVMSRSFFNYQKLLASI